MGNDQFGAAEERGWLDRDWAGGSLLRKTLVVAGALLGASAVWVALLSVISVLIADRIVLSPRERGVAAATVPTEVSTTPLRAPARPTPKSEVSKPNG